MKEDELTIENEEELFLRLGLPPTSISRLLDRSFPDLASEIKFIHKLCHHFVASFLEPHLAEAESAFENSRSRLDRILLNKINEFGFLSLWIPRIFGGGGFHPLTMNVFHEIIGSHCLGTANIVGAHYVGLTLISLAQNFSILERLCLDIKNGEKTHNPCLVTAAITEPTAGSDKEDLTLLKKSKAGSWAHPFGTSYLLNGSKIFISNASWASYHVVVTTESPDTPEQNLLILVVPSGAPGLNIGLPEKKLGQHACPASMIFFNDCLVSSEWVALAPQVFPKSEDYQAFSEMINDGILALTRAGVAALSAGSCAASLRITTQFLNKIEMNSPLKQNLQTKIGLMTSNFLMAKTSAWNAALTSFDDGPFRDLMNPVIYKFLKYTPRGVLRFIGSLLSANKMQSRLCAGALKKQPLRYSQVVLGVSSAAKLACSSLAMENSSLALGVLGAASFSEDHNDLFKVIRDSKLLQIYEGTNQLNALHVYKGLGVFNTPLFEDPMSEGSYD